MALDLSIFLHYDSTTLLLVSIVILLYTLRAYVQPIPLAHPILLGRQADISKVRRPGETSTYRNYGVGHGAPLPAKPRKDTSVAHDFVQADMIHARTLWETQISNEDLKKRYQNLARGLIRSVGVIPEKSSGIMLLDDSFEWLLIDLALSSIGVHTITPTRLQLLSPILENHQADVIFADVSLLESVVEQVAELGNHFPIVVIGPGASGKAEASRNTGFNVVSLEEVELVGKESDSEVHTVESQAERLFSTSFYADVDGVPVGVQLTHQNLTAGPTAIRQFFTLTTPLSSSSMVLSAFPLSTPFGRAIAYTTLFEGSSFATLESTSLLKNSRHQRGRLPQNIDELIRATAAESVQRPTHLFITPKHLESITYAITSHNASSLFGSLAWSRKVVELTGGSLSDSTFWDGFGGLKEARRVSFGYRKGDEWVKAVVVAGGPSDELTFPKSRIALSVPLINAHIEPTSTAPILASHPFDLQHFPAQRPGGDVVEQATHVGPPAANMEVKLMARTDEEVDETKNDPAGTLFYRGPAVGEPVPLLSPGKKHADHQWVNSGRRATVHSNGTFRVLD